MGQAAIVKLSDDEVEFLLGAPDPRLARERLWTEHTQLMVVTRGPRGCVWLTGEHQGEVAGFPVAAIATTGAGDGFVAGLLHGLVQNPGALAEPARLEALCRFACAVGALATTARGAIPALPARAQVEQFLREQQGGRV
jgi:fructokinase